MPRARRFAWAMNLSPDGRKAWQAFQKQYGPRASQVFWRSYNSHVRGSASWFYSPFNPRYKKPKEKASRIHHGRRAGFGPVI